MQTAFVFLVCLLSSTIGGVCGIGGGVVIKPVLDATGVMGVSSASFLAGLTVLAMALISVYKNRKTRELDARRSIPLGLGAALGGLLGKALFDWVRRAAGAERIAGAAQAALLGVMVFLTLLYVKNKARIRTHSLQSPLAGGGVGLALGLCSSFLGIGGGPMNLAVLSYCYSMPSRKAAVNSILIILISQLASLLTTLASASVPAFAWTDLCAMVAAGALGGLLSARLHRRLTDAQTDALFSALLWVILGVCAFNAWRALAG